MPKDDSCEAGKPDEKKKPEDGEQPDDEKDDGPVNAPPEFNEEEV